MVVDQRVGFRELERDVRNGRWQPMQLHTVVVLVGRENVRQHDRMVVVLEAFWMQLCRKGFSGKLVITGPLPNWQ